MPTDRRRKTDPELTPFQDPAFRRHSVHFDDIETQRRFEQNLIRYNIPNEVRITEIVNTIVNAGGGGGGGGGHDIECYWVQEGSNLVYYDGNVGVKVHPHSNDFEVRGNVLVEAKAEAAYVEIRNWSDTAYDPTLRWALGATPETMFCMGVDDSDSNKLKIANGSVLGSTAGWSFGTTIIFGNSYSTATNQILAVATSALGTLTDYSLAPPYTPGGIFNSIYVHTDGTIYITDNDYGVAHFDANLNLLQLYTNSWFTATSAVYGICYWDGYFYVATSGTGTTYDGVFQFDSTFSVATRYLGSADSGDPDYIVNPKGVATDGTYFYVCNNAVGFMVFTMAGVYVETITTANSLALTNIWGVQADGTYIYITERSGDRIVVLSAANRTWVADLDTSGANYTPWDVTVDDDYVYACVFEDVVDFIRVIKFQKSDWSLVSDTQVKRPGGLFSSSRGIGILRSYTSVRDLIVLHQDGSYLEVYPVTRFMDDIRLHETGLTTSDYVGLAAPAAVTASYTLALPVAAAGATKHLYSDAANQLAFGQDVTPTGSPTFVTIKLTALTDGYLPYHVSDATGLANSNLYHDGNNIGLGQTTFGTNATKTLALSTGVAPTTSPADAFQMYSADVDGVAGKAGVHFRVENGGIVGIGKGRIYFSPGFGNYSIGYNCHKNITSGDGNLAFGYEAQASLTTGGSNVGIGVDCQYYLTEGSENLAIGQNAQNGITLGSNNTAFGGGSQRLLSTGTGNTALGSNSMWMVTTGIGNIALGYGAGTGADFANAPDTDDYGILIGYQANRSVVSATKLTNYIGIGYGTLIDKSNQVKIGNSSIVETILYGNLGVGGQGTFGTSADKVIAIASGTAPATSPANTIQLYSADFAAGNACPYFRTEGGTVIGLNQSLLTTDGPTFASITLADGGWVGQAAGPLLTFDDTNNYLEITGCRVGIGTATPGGALHVSQAANAISILECVGDYFPFASLKRSGGSAKTNAEWIYYIDDGGGFRFYNATADKTPLFISLGADNWALYIDGNENVGISQTTFGTSAAKVLALATGTAPTTSPADAFQNYSADAAGVAGHATPHWRSEAGGIFSIEGGAGTVHEYRYSATLADDAVLTLPFSITNVARGFIAIGNNQERTGFWIDNDGDVVLINNSTNVVANADTDANLCVGTAAAQEPLQIKNRLGSSLNLFLVMWYN